MNINNNLPQPIITSNFLENEIDCNICMDELSQDLAICKMPEDKNVQKFILIDPKYDKNPIQTKCNHIFHLECLKRWAGQKKDQTSCPVCRDSFNFTSDATIPQVVNDDEAWVEIMERYGYEEFTINVNDLLSIGIRRTKITGVMTLATIVGELFLQIITSSFSLASCTPLVFAVTKVFGLPLVAFAIGALFRTFLPRLICRRSNPESGLIVGHRMQMLTAGFLAMTLGPHNLIYLARDLLVGVGIITTSFKVAAYIRKQYLIFQDPTLRNLPTY